MASWWRGYSDEAATFLVENGFWVSVVNPAHIEAQKDLLISIPGLGELTIGKLLAECRDLPSFHVRQLVAFAGLNPRQHVSGSSVYRKATISRTGSASLRAFAVRLRADSVPPKAIVVAVMRKLWHLIIGVLKSGQPFKPLWTTPS